MIQEILEYYFDRKIEEHCKDLINTKTFKEGLAVKLDCRIFSEHVRNQA